MNKNRRNFACAVAFAALMAPVQVSAQALEWNHDPASTLGPSLWGSLSFPFATCGSRFDPVLQAEQPNQVEVGRKQTPIDIATANALPTPLPALVTQYLATPLIVENTGHVAEVPVQPGSVLRIGQDTYGLLQFHLHAPSEHTLNGQFAAGELHLVHRNSLLDLAVVGVMLQIAPPGTPVNAAVEAILQGVPEVAGEEVELAPGLDPRQVLPPQLGYYSYSGSLTTPPCSEGVRWFVLKQPVYVSQEAIDRYHDVIAHFPGYAGFRDNNRPVRPLNGRAVLDRTGS